MPSFTPDTTPFLGGRHHGNPQIGRSQPSGVAEHELCWVYAGRSAERPRPNIHEIAAWRYVTPQALLAEIAGASEAFTPWFKHEWERLLRDHPRVSGTPRTG
jgi:isopentenyldiphosphate isomerase